MKQLNILSVPDMLLLNSMKFYYKYKRNEVPYYFTSFNLHTQGSTHDYNTRQRDDIRTNRVRINLTEKCLRNYLTKTINSIPNQILNRIDTHSMEGFASAVKHHLISKYGLVCQNESCYVCQCQPRSWCVNRLLRKYLPKTINSIPNQILNRIDTHSMEGFASAVKHHLISKYGLVCQNESCYVCQCQPRSWCVNRLIPVNHYVHIPPFIDTLFLTAHLVH